MNDRPGHRSGNRLQLIANRSTLRARNRRCGHGAGDERPTVHEAGDVERPDQRRHVGLHQRLGRPPVVAFRASERQSTPSTNVRFD